MKKEKKDLTRKIIRQLGADKPGEGFTDDLMKRIEAEEALTDKAFASIFRKHASESLPDGFAVQVMSAIEKEKIYKPVISRKGWMGIAACIIAFIFLAGLSGRGDSKGIISLQFNLHEYFPARLIPEINFSPVLVLSIAAIAILISIEFLFSKRNGIRA